MQDAGLTCPAGRFALESLTAAALRVQPFRACSGDRLAPEDPKALSLRMLERAPIT